MYNNKFITKNKNQIISDLISMSVDDLENLIIDYKNKLSPRELSFIEDIIEFLKNAYIETKEVNDYILNK